MAYNLRKVISQVVEARLPHTHPRAGEAAIEKILTDLGRNQRGLLSLPEKMALVDELEGIFVVGVEEIKSGSRPQVKVAMRDDPLAGVAR